MLFQNVLPKLEASVEYQVTGGEPKMAAQPLWL